MTVVVSFISHKALGLGPVLGVGVVRVREDITIPGSTTATAQAGEIVLVGNGETSMVAIAFGTTPDAAALAATAATSAGFVVPAGCTSQPICPPAGAKINVKAVT